MDQPESRELKFEADTQERLDRFLARCISGQSRTRLAQLISDGHVTVEGAPAKAGLKLKPGWRVELMLPAEKEPHHLNPASIPLEVLFEDSNLLVVSKPRGLPTHPASTWKGPTLVNALLARGGKLSHGSADFRPGIVHRLDKDTTGLLIVAKKDSVHRKLAKMIQTRQVKRSYVVIVEGKSVQPRFDVDAPIGRDPQNRQKMAVRPEGKPAVTHFFVLDQQPGRLLLEAKLETGRTHQIRVHLAAIGLPVIGDPVYGIFGDDPLQLHAWRLQFTHPETGAELDIQCPPPADFSMPAFDKLRRNAQVG